MYQPYRRLRESGLRAWRAILGLSFQDHLPIPHPRTGPPGELLSLRLWIQEALAWALSSRTTVSALVGGCLSSQCIGGVDPALNGSAGMSVPSWKEQSHSEESTVWAQPCARQANRYWQWPVPQGVLQWSQIDLKKNINIFLNEVFLILMYVDWDLTFTIQVNMCVCTYVIVVSIKKFRVQCCCDNWASRSKMYMSLYLTPCTKINSKWITDLNVRSRSIKLLGKKDRWVSLHDLGLGNNFLDMTLIAQAIKF